MKLRYALLAATLIAGGAAGVAVAQRAPVYDPAQLPEVKGKVGQYLLTPRGDVDGLILADGTEVYVAPRLSSQLVYTVKPGDAVTIHGLKAKATALVLAGSVTNDATGGTVMGGPSGPHAGLPQVEATGQVKAQLHSPRGDVDGVLLNDGTIVRLPPPEVQKFAAQLAPGQTLYVHGSGYEGVLGKIVAAQALGVDKDHTQPVAGPRFGGMGRMFGHRGMRGGPDGHGPMMGGPGGGPAPQRP
jgi:hypothetical protein